MGAGPKRNDEAGFKKIEPTSTLVKGRSGLVRRDIEFKMYAERRNGKETHKREQINSGGTKGRKNSSFKGEG